ncbi:MAG: hypothetical protein IPN06_20780 [Burkholderiales bacterium]|nr:hypothetical protein [Burkholderiales bacterium]
MGEHHERLSGSGYPALSGEAISPLGMLLAAVEVTWAFRATALPPDARQLALRGAG